MKKWRRYRWSPRRTRLLDLVQQKHIRLDAVQVLIIDEADRMFDMGFIRDVRKIVALFCHRDRQSMLFSATMPDDVIKLVGDVLKSPERIEVAPQGKTADRVEQKLYYVPMQQKRQLLSELLKDLALNRVIVFTRTKHGANRVAEHLSRTRRGGSEAIHGNKSQTCPPARIWTCSEDRQGAGKAWWRPTLPRVASTLTTNIGHVINFELPNEPEKLCPPHRPHGAERAAKASPSASAILPSAAICAISSASSATRSRRWRMSCRS